MELIDRNSLIEIAKQQGHVNIDDILSVPTFGADPAARGKWIEEPGKIPHCSKCGEYSDDADRGGTFCSFCGAKME